MAISEVLKVAFRNPNIMFTREFHKEVGFNPDHDVYRVNIKGRINYAMKPYAPYEQVAIHTEGLMADDWVFITTEEIAKLGKKS